MTITGKGHNLKVPYYEKHIFFGLYTYKLVLPEPANSQNEESKQVLHGLCSPPNGNTALLQAVQIQLLLLRKDRRNFHRPTSSARKYSTLIPEVRFVLSSNKLAGFRNVIVHS